MKTILFVVGTRPEAIKIAPVYIYFKNKPELKTLLCITGQHKEMLTQVLDVFNIEADFDLDTMLANQSLSDIVSVIVARFSKLICDKKPDLIVVHGDTATTLSASIAAYMNKVPVAHIEAGLRTNNKYSPWPEEGNRRMLGVLADMHFAPTIRARNNLLAEGVEDGHILVTGNTVIDALHIAIKKIETTPQIQSELLKKFDFIDFSKRILLVTGHRRESFGDGIRNICSALRTLSDRDIEIVYPVHLNPNIKRPVMELLSGRDNIHLIEPVDYLEFLFLMKKSFLILTDSGGVQEEAPSLNKPVLIMRETTERPEGVEAGCLKLVGTNPDYIVRNVTEYIENHQMYEKSTRAENPFGDGKASERIYEFIMKNV